MDDDSIEEEFDDDFPLDYSLDDVSGIKNEPTEDDICYEEFTTKDAVILVSAMGWAYGEGLKEAYRKKLEKKMNANREQSNNHS